jgi:hypothetical protein
MQKQETIARHSGRTKRQADKVSAGHVQERAHEKTTPTASGVILKRGVRRRITQAVRKDNAADARSSGRPGLEQRFERNHAILTTYFAMLEGGGHALPGNPKTPGEVFLPQVEAESGLPYNSLVRLRAGDGEEYGVRLRGVLQGAAKRLRVELRVLPRSPGAIPVPLTYARLLERGTEERRRELRCKRSQRQQLYNTRCALSQFVERSGLDKAAAVGVEFAAGFDGVVTKVAATFKSVSTLKKFMTEIEWWRGFHRGLLKEQAMPADFRGALDHLVGGSGLPLPLVARLTCVTRKTLKGWCEGVCTPAVSSYAAVMRIEKLFKLPAGTLVSKLSSRGHGGRFRRAQLPEFLREDPKLSTRVTPHLPDDFCELPLETQREIVESVRAEVIRGNDPHTVMVMELSELPYRLADWPRSLEEEFEDLAAFKTGERPPLGMRREGQWRPTTAEKVRNNDLASIFGALSLPGDAEDARVRGLGVPAAHLTMAMFACPLILDWALRFGAERSGKYTGYAKIHLGSIKSLVRPGTGWLRQRPRLASRLRSVSRGVTEFVSEELVARAQSDWDGVCDDAYRCYENLDHELEDKITVGRDPFLRVESILAMDSPMKGLKVLIDGMKGCLPNKVTQPWAYHIAIRDCVLVTLLTVTGLRRTTLSLLDYSGPAGGHLTRRDGRYVLNIPRSLFKVEDSPFFGPKRARKDYFMKLPNAFGLNELLDEYLNVSLPWLLDRFHRGAGQHPLFVTARSWKFIRLVPETVSQIYKRAATRHLVENRWRGTGIPGVMLHGPHSVRHIRGTEAIKRTGSFQTAADANHHSEAMARKHYARFLPADRNELVNRVFFESKEDEDEGEKDE